MAEVLQQLSIKPWELLRRGEKVFKELELDKDAADEALIEAMGANPILIERPIVIHGEEAALALGASPLHLSLSSPSLSACLSLSFVGAGASEGHPGAQRGAEPMRGGAAARGLPPQRRERAAPRSGLAELVSRRTHGAIAG